MDRRDGRPVWNSQRKMVIAGRTPFSDPDEGIERFLRSAKDVKRHFVTWVRGPFAVSGRAGPMLPALRRIQATLAVCRYRSRE